jgi:hypothetical protein
MPDCECMENCFFFKSIIHEMPATVEIIKRKLCRTDNSHCARYRVFLALGIENVPEELFPYDNDSAEEILRTASHEEKHQ